MGRNGSFGGLESQSLFVEGDYCALSAGCQLLGGGSRWLARLDVAGCEKL